MERDGIAAHGTAGFLKETYMERADKAQIRVCNGCGTVPIYNDQQNLMVCSLCDGPVQFIGTNSTNIEILPTVKKSLATTSVVEMPYATKLLADELQTFMNMGLRIITQKGLAVLEKPSLTLPKGLAEIEAAIAKPLPERILPETRVPEFRVPPPQEEIEPAKEDLYAMGVVGTEGNEGEGNEGESQEEPAFSLGPAAAAEPLEEEEQATPEYAQNVTPPYAQVTPPEVIQTSQQPMLQQQQQQPLLQQQQPMVQQGGGLMSMQQQHAAFMQQGGGLQGMQGMPMVQPYTIAAPLIYQAPVPNAPQTIVIDTSPQAMQMSGYLGDMQMASRGMPVMGAMGVSAGARQVGGGSGSGSANRRFTPRARQQSPSRSRPMFGSAGGNQGGPPPPSTRVNVQKLG
jgi:hypothetical protein